MADVFLAQSGPVAASLLDHNETHNMTAFTILNSILARALDTLAVLAARVLPIADAGVFYTPGRSWRLDAWREQGHNGDSWVAQAGGFEARVDLNSR